MPPELDPIETEPLDTAAPADPEPTGDTDDGEPAAPAPGDAEPAGYTKAINRKHFEMEEERRRADSLQQRVDALEASQQPARPELPELPSPYDENYDVGLKAWQEANTAQAQYDAQQATVQAQQQHDQRQAAAAQQQEQYTTVKTYTDRAEKLNINPQELQAAGNTVAAYGISDQLAMHILQDDQGPLITSYLAKNPAELETLRGLPLIQAGVHLATVIKAKAATATGISNAPDPADGLDGGGAPPSKRGPKGATFE